MEQKLFSESLATHSGIIESTALVDSIQALTYFLGKEIKILSWDDSQIAIPLNCPVDLPPLGNFEKIDIRDIEPVLIVIHIKHYPFVAPLVYTDRLDFPKDSLAHLYVAQGERPPAFCMVRGNRNEWYADKQLRDVVVRISNWLRDAAAGLLTEDNDQFDPLRLESYSGINIYDYDVFASIVNNKQAILTDGNIAIGLFEAVGSGDVVSFRFIKVITQETITETRNEVYRTNDDRTAERVKLIRFGYIIWSNESTVYNTYNVDLPEDWETLKKFCADYAIGIDGLEGQLTDTENNRYLNFPVIAAIRRSKNLIGFSSNLEFVNFRVTIDSDDYQDGKIIKNFPVKFQKHSQPLTMKKANAVSGSFASLTGLSLVAGCGALGSKIVMHLARSGSCCFMLADPDELLPHNLVRHALLSGGEGKNKAEALKQEIKKIFPTETKLLATPFDHPADSLLAPNLFGVFEFIFDFTASGSFLNSLINANAEKTPRACKAYISDFGKLGILLFEGSDRNPRVDDLQVCLYAKSRQLKPIAAWLQREKDNDQHVNVAVGVGCNSETIVLADDVVSLHASFFSGVIKVETKESIKDNGRIYLNEIKDDPFFHNVPSFFDISKMVLMNAVNDPAWQIRMVSGIIEMMEEAMIKASPRETGGVYIGSANYKTKTIHVVGLVKAPPDSRSNAVCFFRGVKGLPAAIEEVNEQSGGQLGYIGEWHSHPDGPEGMSQIDSGTVQRFKKEFEQMASPLPVFLMIITPKGVFPFVY